MAETNILIGSTVTTSSDIGYPGSNTIDGNPDTWWHSAQTGPPFWIKFDLGVGGGEPFLKYYYQGRSSGDHYWKNWQLQGSNDDSNWDVLDERTGIVGADATKLEFACVCEVPYRYLRFYITLTESDYCVATEIGVIAIAPACFISQRGRNRLNMKGVSLQNQFA